MQASSIYVNSNSGSFYRCSKKASEEFIEEYSRKTLMLPLFSHDMSGDTFKIKIPSRYSNFSTTFFNANKEPISYGDLNTKCRIKILMETSGIWSNSRCSSFYFHAKEVLTDLRN